jgi:hypothetical protein
VQPSAFGGTGRRRIGVAVGSVLIALQASREDGRSVTRGEFLDPLSIRPGEVEAIKADGGRWAAGLVYFAVVRYGAFDHIDTSEDAGAQSEAFFAGVVDAFRGAARFLDRRPPSVTASMRAAGMSLRLFVDVRMDQDQMELELPPELLAACGRHSLGVYVISNDISYADALEARRSTR